jgi:predicted membrane chloride channel (bestrophin family)
LLQKISSEAQKNTIVQCYNTNCQNLPEALRIEPKKSVFKAYLQLQQSTATKFTIDQKQVLKYLNEFLTKSSTDGSTNGEIESISFG